MFFNGALGRKMLRLKNRRNCANFLVLNLQQ